MLFHSSVFVLCAVAWFLNSWSWGQHTMWWKIVEKATALKKKDHMLEPRRDQPENGMHGLKHSVPLCYILSSMHLLFSRSLMKLWWSLISTQRYYGHHELPDSFPLAQQEQMELHNSTWASMMLIVCTVVSQLTVSYVQHNVWRHHKLVFKWSLNCVECLQGQKHLLVIARRDGLDSIEDVRIEHLPVLQHLHSLGETWATSLLKEDPSLVFRLGYHWVNPFLLSSCTRFFQQLEIFHCTLLGTLVMWSRGCRWV